MARHIFRVYGNILPAYAGYCRKHMCHNHTQSNEYVYVYIYITREAIRYVNKSILFCFGKGTKNADTRFSRNATLRDIHYHWSAPTHHRRRQMEVGVLIPNREAASGNGIPNRQAPGCLMRILLAHFQRLCQLSRQ